MRVTATPKTHELLFALTLFAQTPNLVDQAFYFFGHLCTLLIADLKTN